MGRSLPVVLVCALTVLLVVGAYALYLHGPVNIMGVKLCVDTLSMLFILNIGLVTIACAVSSYRYLDLYTDRSSSTQYFAFLATFAASMILIPMVRNWLLFLFLWEVMTLTSYVLIIHGYGNEALRAGRNYFITMHILDTTPLIVMIALLRLATGTYDFAEYSSLAGIILATAIIGFGTKAGLFPLHFWLPEAHPAAPSPVSAMLSGTMVELGVYGIFRVVKLSSVPIPLWCVYVMVAVAVLSMLAAVFMYVLQDDAKRLFAWSTIDNVGWMTLIVVCSILGLDGAEKLLGLYVLCHGLAKAATFLASGNMIYVYGTRSLSNVKGMINTCRSLAVLMLFSMLALEGVPPFNLFLSKLSVLTEALRVNVALGIFVAIEWCVAFVIFLSIIHKYILSSGEPRTVRSLPVSMAASNIFLLVISMVAYPLAAMILGW